MSDANRGQLATIVVRRPAPLWRDGGRKYGIHVDGREVGKVRGGNEVSVTVSPGRHFVRARIDWTGSPEVQIDVVDGERVILSVEPAGSSLRLDQIFGSDRYLNLKVVERA